MKCSLALLLLLVSMSILSLPAMAQDWTVIPLGTSEDILDVENTGFPEKSIVGSGGFFAQSSANRTVWTQIDVGTSADLLSVHQPSLGQLWTGGGGGAVRRFLGGSWVARDVPGGGEDYTIFSRSSGASWAVGTGGSIYRTTNGGTTWTLSYSAAVALHSGSGFIGSTAYAVGDLGTILKTTDGGTDWTALDSGTNAHLYDFVEGGQSTGLLAVGSGGTIIHSLDGGTTWSVLPGGTTADLHAVSYSKQNSLWLMAVGAGGVVLRSTDGGASWCELESGTSEDLYGVEMVNNSECVIGGANGLLLRSTTGGGSCVDPSGLDHGLPGQSGADGQSGSPVLVLRGPFPNPVSSHARFLASAPGAASSPQTFRLDVMDASGRKIMSHASGYPLDRTPTWIEVDVSEWRPGFYYVRLFGPAGDVTQPLVVVR